MHILTHYIGFNCLPEEFILYLPPFLIMAASESWNDPDRCPFCGTLLTSPGAGFMVHLGENPDCEGEFETWRERICDDIGGGWSG